LTTRLPRSAAPDANGDAALDDVIIGARFAYFNGIPWCRQSYVVLAATVFWCGLDLSTLNGSNGFAINGIRQFIDQGQSVSSAGDVNGDGFDDLIIAAYSASQKYLYAAGQSYVVFGSNSGFGASLNLSTLNGSSNGFAINLKYRGG